MGVGKTRILHAYFTNNGDFPTGDISIQPLTGEWAIVKNECTSLDAFANGVSPRCDVDIAFTPTSSGAKTVTLKVKSASGASTEYLMADTGGAVCGPPGSACATGWCSEAEGCSPKLANGDWCNYGLQCTSGTCSSYHCAP